MAITEIISSNDYFYQWRAKINNLIQRNNDYFIIDGVTFTIIKLTDNTLSVSAQLTASEESLTEKTQVFFYLSDDQNGNSIIQTAHSGGIEVVTGMMIIQTEDKSGWFITNTTGQFSLNLLETVANKTVYLVVVLPSGKIIISDAIEHDTVV